MEGYRKQKIEGSITGSGGEHHGMDGIQGTIVGWRAQQQVAVTDSLCLGGRKPVHPAGGQSAGCQ